MEMSLLDLVANNMIETDNDTNTAAMQAKLEELVARFATLTATAGPAAEIKVTETKKEATVKVAKNKRPVKAAAGRKYVLLSKTLANWGRVPQQQADLAVILANNFEVGKEVSEQEVFDVVTEKSADYASLAGAVQHPTYLFAYYRGLGCKDAKHAGFVYRDFVRQIN
jgi:hypothetical protein